MFPPVANIYATFCQTKKVPATHNTVGGTTADTKCARHRLAGGGKKVSFAERTTGDARRVVAVSWHRGELYCVAAMQSVTAVHIIWWQA